MSGIEDMRRSIIRETVALNRAAELRALMGDLLRIAHQVGHETGIETAELGGVMTETVAALGAAQEGLSQMIGLIMADVGSWARDHDDPAA